MMTKEEVINLYHEITADAGVDRNSVLYVLRRGKIAERDYDGYLRMALSMAS